MKADMTNAIYPTLWTQTACAPTSASGSTGTASFAQARSTTLMEVDLLHYSVDRFRDLAMHIRITGGRVTH
jgi:hypothetical protein